MTDVSQKKAVDYEAPKDMPDNRTAEEVEADLQRVREELTATVNELAGKLHPDNLKAEARSFASAKFAESKEKAMNLVKDAKNGDRKALSILGAVAGVVALIVIRKTVKK
ncbi:hypothetical protein CQ11_08840 [Trueperella pyogenes]|uniref:DUF3618 domain-containing protein n=1 Tax=Trueperella pyogenes TaxID=1661 RepID=UPI00043AC280|nr:DUF3618 domain-containing protein [Trueperella pyogenes]AHU90043.1 hypothetical protein CQ11_08840 [Trueperella pyogenes]